MEPSPNGASLTLDHVKEAGTDSILDRREMGIVNIGDAGTVSAGGTEYALNRGDVLYLPKGAGAVTFAGNGRFYITSTPAHKTLEAKLITLEDANKVKMGAPKRQTSAPSTSSFIRW